ncbi:MAG TPA: hypothetical protein VF292_06440 [Rhodanobacteraceae bacterium]
MNKTVSGWIADEQRFPALVSKVWNMAHVLRDRGISYGDYKANVLFFDKRPPRADGATNSKAVWIYDFRTNRHFTLKKNPLQRSDLDDFVACYAAANRGRRQETGRFKRFGVDELLKRDKLNLDIFWLKDDSLEDVDSLSPPDQIAAEIVDNLQEALEAFQSVVDELAATPANRQGGTLDFV